LKANHHENGNTTPYAGPGKENADGLLAAISGQFDPPLVCPLDADLAVLDGALAAINAQMEHIHMSSDGSDSAGGTEAARDAAGAALKLVEKACIEKGSNSGVSSVVVTDDERAAGKLRPSTMLLAWLRFRVCGLVAIQALFAPAAINAAAAAENTHFASISDSHLHAENKRRWHRTNKGVELPDFATRGGVSAAS
jgi:hypothetical protein